jgi:hypothetical protein
MTPDLRLDLKEAVRRYWWRLLPLPFFAPFACYLSRYSHDSAWSVPVIFAVFFAVSIFSLWPAIRSRVRMSFVHFGGLLYVVGGFLLYALCEILIRAL